MNYIGSKYKLSKFIKSEIEKVVGQMKDKVFCDLFAGTGAIGRSFKTESKKIIANDIEVYAFDFPNKIGKEALDLTFSNLEIIEVNREIADQAIIYRKNKSKKIKLPDAITLASAKYINAELLTDDWDDFQMNRFNCCC